MTHKLRMLTYLYRVIQLKSRNNYQNKIKKIRKSLEHKSYVTCFFSFITVFNHSKLRGIKDAKKRLEMHGSKTHENALKSKLL